MLTQNFGVTKKSITVFSGVVNCASSVGIPSHIAGTTGLKQRKLCTCSDWPCKMPKRMAKVENCCLPLNEFWCSQEFRKYVAALSWDWGDSHDVRACFRVVRERYSLRPKMSRKESEESSNTPSVVRRKRDERFSSGSSPEVPPTKSAKQTLEELSNNENKSNVWIVLNKIRRNTDELLEENRAMRRQYEELKEARKNFRITPKIN